MTLGGEFIPQWIGVVCAEVVGRQGIAFCSIAGLPINYGALLLGRLGSLGFYLGGWESD